MVKSSFKATVQYTTAVTYTIWCVILCIFFQACSFTLAVKDGRTAYDLKQYARAVEMLNDDYTAARKPKDKDELAYLIGKSYDYMGDFSNSLLWMKKCGGERHSLEALRDLGHAYKKNGLYMDAKRCFVDLLKKAPGDPRFTQEVYTLQRLIEEDEKKKYVVNLHPASTIYNDFAPIIYDHNSLLITSDREGGVRGDSYAWTGNSYSDFYLISNRGGDIDGSFISLINTDNNEGSGCFNKDFTEFYFTRCGEGKNSGNCKIYRMKYVDEDWSIPEPLAFQAEESNYGQPTLIESDAVMVFSSDATGTRGGSDLFYTERLYLPDSTYTWSQAIALPQTINSEGNEVFPVGYNDTLYYSSDGLAGRGGLDIYKTYLNNGQWSVPKALPSPINSAADDMSFIIDTSKSTPGNLRGYFASNRKGLGGDDIYRFEPIKPSVVKEKENDPTASKEEVDEIIYYLAVQVVTPLYARENDPNSNIINYAPLQDANLRVITESNIKTGSTDDKGRWIRELKMSDHIIVRGSKNGFLEAEKTIHLDSIKNGATVNVRLILNPVFLNTEITLENILYDFNKWDIRKDAEPALDSLASIMRINNGMKILLSSHTDCRGEEAYNLILSQKRAQSAVDYLIKSGIARSRLKAKGYGESAPKVDCDCESCSEEEHQKNRRTAFSIIEMR